MCAAYQLLLDRRWDPKAVAKEATEDDVYSKDSHAGTWGSSATIPATLRGFRKKRLHGHKAGTAQEPTEAAGCQHQAGSGYTGANWDDPSCPVK